METDYISRQAAINIVCDGECDDCPDGGCDMYRRLKRLPAADVRPVVLCRDCKHFNPYPGDCTDGGIEGVCKRHNSIGVLVMDDDFCSDAERI